MIRVCISPAVFGCLSLFVGLSMLVVSGVTQPVDDAAILALGAWRTPVTIEMMLVMSFLGDGTAIAVVGLGICALLWARGRPRAGLALLLGGIVGELIYLVAKASFQRARPDLVERLSSHGWHSYPSGHTTITVVVLSLGLVLLADALPRWRRSLWALAVVVPCCVAFARVGLSVHYPSDVVGALALGWASVFFWRDWSRTPSTSRSASTS